MIEPSENDILLGRGGKNNKNEGNEKLRILCRKNASKYDKSSKKEKALIIDSLLGKVFGPESLTRFLFKNKDSGHWEVAGRSTAREKVSQALRDAVYEHEKEEVDVVATLAVPEEHQSYHKEKELYIIGNEKLWESSTTSSNPATSTTASTTTSSSDTILRRRNEDVAPETSDLLVHRHENFHFDLNPSGSTRNQGRYERKEKIYQAHTSILPSTSHYLPSWDYHKNKERPGKDAEGNSSCPSSHSINEYSHSNGGNYMKTPQGSNYWYDHAICSSEYVVLPHSNVVDHTSTSNEEHCKSFDEIVPQATSCSYEYCQRSSKRPSSQPCYGHETRNRTCRTEEKRRRYSCTTSSSEYHHQHHSSSSSTSSRPPVSNQVTRSMMSSMFPSGNCRENNQLVVLSSSSSPRQIIDMMVHV